MRAILHLAWHSLAHRRGTVLLTLLSIAFSTLLLLGVERLRTEVREGFAGTIAGTDLIIGARTGQIQLLLYSVFHLGDATNNIRWESFEAVAKQRQVAWAVPISLGDSHRGYRVVGTTPAYFEHYHFGHDQTLGFVSGGPFQQLYDAVIGAEVAEKLGYRLGDRLIVAHGTGNVSLKQHDDKPFQVAGILAPTGTPVDRSVLVSLEAIEAIHIGWTPELRRPDDLKPRAITAMLVGLKSRAAAFQMQRFVNDYSDEPLLAVLPGVALAELWKFTAVAEGALRLIAGFVVLVGLIGMMTAILTGLEARRREMAVLRAVGAQPLHLFALLLTEAIAVTGAGLAAGLALLYAAVAVAGPQLTARFGLHLSLRPPTQSEWLLLALVFGAGLLLAVVPAIRAYRQALADGLIPKL